MTPTSTVPITISPEATAYINELGLQGPFQQMLEHAQQTIPEVRAIRVTRAPAYDLGDDPRVIFDVFKGAPPHDDDPTEQQWIRWVIATFSPEVFTHFCLLTQYGSTDAR